MLAQESVVLGEKFQDRSLNQCDVCGTKKKLGVTFDSEGKKHFFCWPHYLLTGFVMDELEGMGFTRRLF